MSTVVVNCYHWIGFHFVQMLLARGEEVIGFHDEPSDKNTFLSMFLGRNHSFTHVRNMPEKAHKVIVIGSSDSIPEASITIQCIAHLDKKQRSREDNSVLVYMPIIFGEWMPMNAEGIVVRNELLPFDSDTFINEAIYVKDFINCCLPLLDGAFSPTPLHIKARNMKGNKEIILENEVYFRDNRGKAEMIKKVQQHYVDYTNFYYE